MSSEAETSLILSDNDYRQVIHPVDVSINTGKIGSFAAHNSSQ